jgi:hypothetical protein
MEKAGMKQYASIFTSQSRIRYYDFGHVLLADVPPYNLEKCMFDLLMPTGLFN